MSILIFFVVVIVGAFIWGIVKAANSSPDELAQMSYGPINPGMTCPHCSARGKIRTKLITQKKGVSGGKATAAILTGGITMLATGLSRKESNTQAHCMQCTNTWIF